MKEGMHKIMRPKGPWESCLEYAEFKLMVFRNHIYQLHKTKSFVISKHRRKQNERKVLRSESRCGGVMEMISGNHLGAPCF